MPIVRPTPLIKRTLIFVHRWLGVALSLLFLLWFPSGIVMMYWPYPEVSPADRLEHASSLDPASMVVSPADVVGRLELENSLAQVRITTFNGRPVYRIRADGEQHVVYADTGEPREAVTAAILRQVAARWTGQPPDSASEQQVQEPDQWTVQNYARFAPVRKFSWPDGQQVYVTERNAEVVQATTTTTRFWAYLGAIPHWFYFTPLRTHGLEWSRTVTWSSAVATVTAILGVVIGLWMYSPGRRYRYAGVPTSIPYRGQKRWHTIFGLIFGVGAVTWAFSGMLSMEPFPLSRVGDEEIPTLPEFRSPGELADFARSDPRAVLDQLPRGAVRELEFTTFDGTPVYIATMAGGDTRVIGPGGTPQPEFDRDRIMQMIRRDATGFRLTELRVLDEYDRYYLDRTNDAPLPVIVAQFDDVQKTRVYVDPKTATIVTGYQSGDWMRRWLYHGLHSLNFPWLYKYRPLWDIVVITFMVGGTALCVTSLVLAWRVLGRTLRGWMPAAGGQPASEDLV